MMRHPVIHLSDVVGGSVCVEKLMPILKSALRHQLSLPLHSASSPGDTDVRLRELRLNRSHKSIYIWGTLRLRTRSARRWSMN